MTSNPSSSIKLSVIPTEQVEEIWHVVQPLLAKAEPYALGRYVAHDLLAKILDQRALLMIAWDPEPPGVVYAAFVAQAQPFDRKTVFNIILAGGEHIEQWAHLYPAFRDVAANFGCQQLQIFGRRGWKKYIEAPEVATVFVEELSYGRRPADTDG